MSEQLGRFRRVYSVRDWLQQAVQSLDDGQRVTWLYCLTGPQSTSVGIYRLSTAVAVEDLGNVTAEEFEGRFGAVCAALGWQFDRAVRVLWIPGWLEDNPPQSPNVVVNWKKLLANVPDCAAKAEAVDAIHRFLKDRPEAFRKAFGSYRVSLPDDIEKSKAKPKSSPKANQGSGNQGSGIQRNREQAAALRAGALNGMGNGNIEPGDQRLEKIARRVLKDMPGLDVEGLVDAFFWHCRNDDLQANRDAALRAFKATGMVS